MRNRLWIVSLLLVPSGPFWDIAARDEPARAARPPAETAAPAVSAARSCNRFGIHLFTRLRAERGNVFFSPTSVEMALAMASEGAAGETARHMKAVLHLSSTAARGFAALRETLSVADTAGQLAVANAIWCHAHATLRRDFLARLGSGHGADLEPVDFDDPPRATAAINGWVKRATHGRIPDLIAPGAIQRSDRLVLTNAIYFRGRWRD